MLAVFSNGDEVIICELDSNKNEITNGYFHGDGRDAKEYDYATVEAPVRIAKGSLSVRPERILTGSV